MKKILVLMLGVLFVANFAIAENMKDAKIKTNAQCNDCKAKIEKSLTAIKGVKSAVVDLKKKVTLVKYDADLTNKKELETAVKAGCSATASAKCDGKCKDTKDAKCCKDAKKDAKPCDKASDGKTCDPKKCKGK